MNEITGGNGRGSHTILESGQSELSKPLLGTARLRGVRRVEIGPVDAGLPASEGQPQPCAVSGVGCGASAPRVLSPREEPGFNSLTQDDGAPPPEFVGTVYQRRKADGPEGILVPEWAVPVSRTKAELVVLAQIAYWFGETKKGQLRAKTSLDGFWWVYKSYAKLAKEVHLTRDQVRGAVRSLVGRGLLLTTDGSGGVDLPHYRLNPMAIEREVEQAERGLAAKSKSGATRNGPVM